LETTSTFAFAGYGNTWVLLTGSSSQTCQFDRGNVTGCHSASWACGLTFNPTHNTIFEFCEIQSNNGTNCILFYGGTVSSIRCLSVRSNVCTGSAAYGGLFWANVPVTVADSLITGNTYGYFLDGGASTATMTFANCHFDSFTFPTTGGGWVTTADCLTDAASVSFIPTCVTQPRTRTVTVSPDRTAEDEDGHCQSVASVRAFSHFVVRLWSVSAEILTLAPKVVSLPGGQCPPHIRCSSESTERENGTINRRVSQG
jgi:hypothetical protein